MAKENSAPERAHGLSNMKSRSIVFLAFAIAMTFALAELAPAKADMSIQATVNGIPITTYDVNQRARLLQLTARTPAATAKKIALDELIDETLQLQATQRTNIRVTDREVDGAYASIAERVKLTPKSLSSALRQSGVEPKTLKSRLRAQIGWQQMINAGRNQAGATTTEQEVIAALRADKNKNSGKPAEAMEYEVTQLTFVIPKSAGKTNDAARKKEITNLSLRFESCRQGLAIARKLPDVVVKPLGKQLETELRGPFLQLIKETDVGRLTKPLRTPNGFEALAVCGKRQVNSSAAAIQAMSQELQGKEAKMVARRFMRDLRRDAMIEYKDGRN